MRDMRAPSVRPVAWVPPEVAAARLKRRGGLAWLDSERSGSPFARWSFLAAAPRRRLQVTRRGVTLDGRSADGPVLDFLRAEMAPTRGPAAGGPPFRGGWIGYFAYEFAEHTSPWRSPHLGADDAVLAELGFYPAALAWDHRGQSLSLIVLEDEPGAAAAADMLLAAHAEALTTTMAADPRWSMADLAWTPTRDRAAVMAAVARTRDYIAQGDIYQANIAQGFSARLPEGAAPFEHYLMLRRANPAPFGAFLDCPARSLGSTSPERFLAVSQGAVEARPIKGTIRTGATEAEDREAVRQLSASEKERAENVMIVDLLRNDLSRVCRPHTVKTPEICAVETYEGLHHLVSSVTGVLKPGRAPLDAVFAAFPGGSITGAPKLRAMEIIAELEPERRGVFCGAIGYIGVDGAVDLNVAIRTVEYEGRDARLLAGGGVTLLSDPAAEFDEILLKAERVLGRARP